MSQVNVLPLRLHVDQDTLDFVTRFFEFKDDTNPPPSSTTKPEPPFLQRIEISAIPVKLDYKPKKVDYAGLRSGHTTEFMNFFILDSADMTMRRIILHGISGFDKMGKVLNDAWMPDIKANQLGGVLAGVAPVRSLVNLGTGVRDLVVVPVREYKKDGRIVRSVQKGVNGFVRTTAGELIRLGAKVAVGTQTLLQNAEGALSPNQMGYEVGTDMTDSILVELPDDSPHTPSSTYEEARTISLYASQPATLSAGFSAARRSVKANFGAARRAVRKVGEEVAEGRGVVGAVARAAPTVVLRPVIGVSEAVGRTLLGAGNEMEPERRRRGEEKYKKHY